MSLKKVELHVHLEGTIPPRLAKQIAARNKIVLPEHIITPDGKGYISRDFLHFLSVYDTLASIIKTPQDYYDITFDYLKSNAATGGIYVEMMYSPEHAEQSSGIPSKEHLLAIQHAIDDAKRRCGIIGRIILTAVRHFGQDAAERVAQQAHAHPFPCVTGFGLGGDEAKYPPKLFAKAYAIAADAGLQCTVHAGEFDTAEKMIEAMTYLPIKRIGHGVHAIHSPQALDMLKEKNITLELCPTSNIVLGLFPDMMHHPLPFFYQEGIKISINSDDPPFMNTSLTHEYQRVQEAYQYTDDTMNAITHMAIHAAFIDEETKKQLIKVLYENKTI